MNKIFCYIVLFFAFFIVYKDHPAAVIVIVCLGFGIYFFLKSRKEGKLRDIFLNRNRKQPDQHSYIEFFILFILLQGMRENSSPKGAAKNIKLNNKIIPKKVQKLEKIEQELIKIIEES